VSSDRVQRCFFHYGTLSLLLVTGFTGTIIVSQINLATAQTPSNEVLRPLLKVGSRGIEVTELQAVLKLLGYFDGAVDGVYGDSTVGAVSRFQQAAGLGKDGIVGSATWDRLFPPDRGSSTAGLSVIPSPSTTQAGGDSFAPKPASEAAQSPPIDFPLLRLGMSGPAVTRLQERLRAIGVLSGTIDGVFGAETQSAVKAAQAKFQLEADGIVGSATWSALMQ
jgi:peptidoglycan hydrolase-like protein with peptidoglycan-binding domain